MEHLAKISTDRACPAQSVVHHAHFGHPEKRKTRDFDSVFDLENAKNSRKKNKRDIILDIQRSVRRAFLTAFLTLKMQKNKRAPCNQKNQNLITLELLLNAAKNFSGLAH